MTEVYDLAMKIGVTGDVLSSLAQISARLTEVATKVEGLSDGFLTLGKNVLALGSAMTGLGIASMLALDKVADYYGEIDQKQRSMIAGGKTLAQVQEAYAQAAKVARDLNMDTADVFNVRRGLSGIVSEPLAARLTPEIAAVQKALGDLGDKSDVLKEVQMWAGNVGGTDDQKFARIMERVNQAMNVSAATQGRVSYEQFAELQKRMPAMDYTFRTQQLPVLAERFANLGGYGGVGMALGTTFQEALKDKKGKIADAVAAGGANLADIQNNPYAILQAIARGMQAQGETVNEANVYNKLAELGLGNARTMPVLANMMLQGGPGSVYEQAVPPGKSAQDIIGLFGGSLPVLKEETINAIRRIFEAIGKAGLTQAIAEQWEQVLGGLRGIEKWVEDTPPEKIKEIADDLILVSKALAGVGVAMVGIGALAMVASPAGLISGLVVALIALAACDYGGIVSGLDSVEREVQKFGAWIRSWFGLFQGGAGAPIGSVTGYSADVGRQLFHRLPTYEKFFHRTDGRLGSLSPAEAPGQFAAAAGAATSSGSDKSKTITAVTNLNINGRSLAQTVQQYIVEALQLSTGAGASNGVDISHGPDSGFASN